MWRIDMSLVESREADRRVKVILLFSMIGVLVGLIVATVMESEDSRPPRGNPLPLLKGHENEPKKNSGNTDLEKRAMVDIQHRS